jgi:hypothetical protein
MSIGGEVDPNHVEDFDTGIGAIVLRCLERHIAGPTEGDERQVGVIRGHDYATGPAAQEWPQLFYELYRDACPVLADGASLLAWGYLFKDVIKGVWNWAAIKEREVYGGGPSTIYSGSSLVPRMVFTGPALVALCYAHLRDTFDVSSDVKLEVFPRTAFPGYSDPDHPGGEESYLVRARADRRTFYYVVKGDGKVLEHFEVRGRKLTSLPLPNFVGEVGGFQVGQPTTPASFTIDAPSRMSRSK